MALAPRCRQARVLGQVRDFGRQSSLRNGSLSIETEDADGPETSVGEVADAAVSGRDGMLSKNASSHSHRKAFVRWVSGHGKQYVDVARAPGTTNYLDGKSHPFPLNPMFRPKPPISDTVKDGVVQDWQSGTGLRQISTKYGVTLERVEAILKLKQIRDRWTGQVSLAALQLLRTSHRFTSREALLPIPHDVKLQRLVFKTRRQRRHGSNFNKC